MKTHVLISLVHFIGLVGILLAIVITRATYLVAQAEVILIERFGQFHRILDAGLHFIIPFVDTPRSITWSFVREDLNSRRYYRSIETINRIDLREAVYDFPKQNVITKDNVTMEINALLYYQVTDPFKAVYEINNLPQAIEKLAQTTLRDVIGSMDLDESLASRETINERLRLRLDDATDKWGVKVNRVELQEVNPPQDIKVAMEKQMRAERDRRAQILEAEGHKQAEILEAEGHKRALIEQAEGEAEAKVCLANAEAKAIEIIRKSLPTTDPAQYIIANNYIRALPEMMKDKDGKMIVVPYEASAVMGSISTIKELLTKK
jgi:regulator of protease activity HflC (stomatin/prohibitin superfamily)